MVTTTKLLQDCFDYKFTTERITWQKTSIYAEPHGRRHYFSGVLFRGVEIWPLAETMSSKIGTVDVE
jgi:hypothetical protein